MCRAITRLVGDVITKSEIKGTKNLIMIGEYSEVPVLQDMLKQALPEMNFIIPPEANLTGLKGAVIYGHEHRKKPKYIPSRVAKFMVIFKKGPVIRV